MWHHAGRGDCEQNCALEMNGTSRILRVFRGLSVPELQGSSLLDIGMIVIECDATDQEDIQTIL